MMSILGEIDSMRLLDMYSFYTTAYATLASTTTFGARRTEEHPQSLRHQSTLVHKAETAGEETWRYRLIC